MNATGLRGGQGRPLGFLALWCESGAAYGTACEHKTLQPPNTLVAHRRAARARLRESPGSAAILAAERPRRECENSEPELLA